MSTFSSIAPGESGGMPTGGGFGLDFSKFGLPEALQIGGGIAQGLEGFMSADEQADLASRNASFSRARAAAEAERYRRDSARRSGAIRAAAGGSGTTISGSTMDVLADQAREEELNRLMILFSGESQARESEAREDSIRRQGRSTLLGGITGGVISALPELLI